ncbi:MAG: hypothetical protein ACYSWU_04365 [Planctomycetota bacterium]|jgi:hypothetical protein
MGARPACRTRGQFLSSSRIVRLRRREGFEFDLTAARSYDSLLDYGKPSLRQHVRARYSEGRSVAGACASRMDSLRGLLGAGHYKVRLTTDDRRRLITWMDNYGQRRGSFDETQQGRRRELHRRMAPMMAD